MYLLDAEERRKIFCREARPTRLPGGRAHAHACLCQRYQGRHRPKTGAKACESGPLL